MRKTSKSEVKKSPVKPTSIRKKRNVPPPAPLIPGEVILGEGDIVALHGRQTLELTVANVGDRPIQVGSHCHFFESNRGLNFDRERAYGFRLQVPAGTAVRFEPGETKKVTLVALGGHRVAYGINGLVNGKLDDPNVRQKAFEAARTQGFNKTRAG
ncbi:MAG TPA: urease subunit beta [Nitrospira sp.]|jgi:urease beta subunit|nr:urease subunit beta [Nitrospira sp.]